LQVSAIGAEDLTWGQAILRKYIRPAAQRVGIQKRFGWHTFRHAYSTVLRSVGTEFKVMQELLRHSSFRSTLDVYTQAVTPAKHAAQAAVVSLNRELRVAEKGTKRARNVPFLCP
jgi:integrase